MNRKMKLYVFKAIMLSTFLSLTGCGDDGKDADPAVTDDLQDQIDAMNDVTRDIAPESCVVCHGDDGVARSGPGHQEEYDEFYQDQVLRVINLAYTNDGTNDIVTFEMTKKDALGVEQDFNCRDATSNPEPDVTDALNIHFVQYDSATREFSDGAASTFWVSIKGTLTYDDLGGCTSTKAQSALGDLDSLDGHIAVYGRDETLVENSAKHTARPKYPFASMITTGTTGTNYVSVANASGCENCHTRPFLKHMYVYGEVNDGTNNDGNDFYVCKTCHLDGRNGGSEVWQILKDDPARHAEIAAGDSMTTAEEDKYAYTTRLMNDVHMSHNMEFGYPQSMKTCNTCHEGKLVGTLADENYTAETCISCHAVDGLVAKMTTNRAGDVINVHDSFKDDTAVLKTTICAVCHNATDPVIPGPLFVEIHNGYDPEIYADDTGLKYSEAFIVKIDDESIDDTTSFDAATNILTINFSATEVTPMAGYAITDIVPTVFVGLYGYDTKHYIIPPHDRDADRNRLLEFPIDGTTENPRFPDHTVTVGAGKVDWQVTVKLDDWADMITDGVIKRAEIGVMPALAHLSVLDSRGRPVLVAMNAPSKTFDLTTGLFDDAYFDDVVDVMGGCNSCHDALATTFHSANRGGNIKICKMCHVPSAAGSSKELQSRSIDSYVHAVHSFQASRPGRIDFTDAVEVLEYEHHIKSEFPRFGILDCESCHNPGMYGVPNQAKSLPSVLSSTDDVVDRNIGTVPSVVVGPAARACGACHRAEFIKADDAGGLAAFNSHTKLFGYAVEDDDGVWDAVVAKIMSLF